MKDKLKEKINMFLWKIIYDKEISIIQKVAQIHQFFSQFNNESLWEDKFPFKWENPKSIEQEIYNIYKNQKDFEEEDFFHQTVNQIIDILLNREIEEIMKEIT